MSLFEQFYACIVRNGACVMGNVKPSALFNFTPLIDRPGAEAPQRLERDSLCLAARLLTSGFNRRFRDRGLHLDVMATTERRVLLFLSRPEKIEALLADDEVCHLLGGAGLASKDCARCVASLGRRMGSCASCGSSAGFPHEVGVILGYPLEDVRAFIADGGQGATACGPWKAYGDISDAQAQWDAMRACRHDIERNYANGTPFEALIA